MSATTTAAPKERLPKECLPDVERQQQSLAIFREMDALRAQLAPLAEVLSAAAPKAWARFVHLQHRQRILTGLLRQMMEK